MNNDTARGIGIGLAIGAVIGMAVGYLTSPQSGRENREWVRERADDVKEKASQIKDKVGTMAGRFRRKGDSHEEENLEEVGT
jgi:gas vesicle protein